jgi:RNA polymerase sigma-70 factor (ECF subfamily)
MDISFLVKKAKDRDITAFTELYSMFSEDMYRFALYMLNSKEDAEDAVQETVITAFKSIGNLRDDSLFKSWLFKILSNQCKAQIKKNKKNPETLPEDDYIFLMEDESVSTQFNSVELVEALKSLTPPDGQIVLLSIIGGFKSDELSKIYNLSPSTIRSKQKRALEKLRIALSN